MKPQPLGQRDLLTQEEAARYFGLSQRKFYRWLKEPHKFVAFYGKRKLILRAELEKYFMQNPEERKAMANGKARLKAQGTPSR